MSKIIHTLKDMLENSRKHIFVLTKDSRNLEFQMEMMTIAAGSREALARRPICSGIVCITAPLAIHEYEIERLLVYGKFHIPLFIPSMFQWYERENEEEKIKTVFGRAEDRLEYILKNHEVPELSSDVRRELAKIVAAAN